MKQPTRTNIVLACGLAPAGLALLRRRPRAARSEPVRTHIDTARTFNRSSALLALSVLTDSAMEHYRGPFDNPAMYTPPIVSALSLLAGLHGGSDHKAACHPVRNSVYLSAALAGVAGTGFHVYNITKRPGRWSWHNLFYAAPIGAPMALVLSGALGAVADRIEALAARGDL
jgi:hypothetical protein